MIRRIIVAILRFSLRIYFKRIEVLGSEEVPRDRPVIFVLNHPNALVDPVFLLCLAPRRVSFLAKAPLFRMPVLGFLVKAMDSLPVYRHQDQGEDVKRNEETFVAARKLLAKGGTIGICPEGVSHDAPGLRPIKTGAARISLAAVSSGDVSELYIVPAGLYYTSKTSFRSSALLYFGKHIVVERVPLDEDGSPPREAVRNLSARIQKALRTVVLDAEHEEALNTIARAERIFSATDNDDSLANELQLRQRFVRAYAELERLQPERLRRLEVRMSRFEEELKQVGLDADELSPPASTLNVLGRIASRTLLFLITVGPAMLGTIIHYPAYRVGGYLARKLSREAEDVISTIKIMSAMLLFPLTWIATIVLASVWFGWVVAAVASIAAPVCGYIAVLFFEQLDASFGGLRALTFFLVKRRFFVRLLAERKAIKSEILSLGNESPTEPSGASIEEMSLSSARRNEAP
jgi:1-acyl-sn-glycerol-3-phosphate acyltransferase